MNAEDPGMNRPFEERRSLSRVDRHEREAKHGHKGAVVWLTGLSGAGKSTLATAVDRALFEQGHETVVLDGDAIRRGLSSDLGFSHEDRTENIRRIAEVARLFAEAGLVAITAFISPYARDRARARQIVCGSGDGVAFVEVHVDAPLAVCEARDPKGLYAGARGGRVAQFTGVSDAYEPPLTPDVQLRTDQLTVDACVARLLGHLAPLIARD